MGMWALIHQQRTITQKGSQGKDVKNFTHGTKKKWKAGRSSILRKNSAYLHSDVEVLAQSLEAFGKEMVEPSRVPPTKCGERTF